MAGETGWGGRLTPAAADCCRGVATVLLCMAALWWLCAAWGL